MESLSPSGKERALLRFFGMETGEKAWDVFVWAMPYVGILAAGLVGLSYAVQLLSPLPVWVHVLAICLAVVYFFFFLARVRQAGEEARFRSERTDPP